MEYSLDGECLASGSGDGSIRIWHTESFHTITSQPYMERPTRAPKHADKLLLGSRNSNIIALSFSRTDSNMLASGGLNGEIKVWNVKEQACVHSFDSGGGPVRSLFYAGGADIACLAVTQAMSIIRHWKAEGTSDFASETVREADRGGAELHRAALSASGSFVATIFIRRTGDKFASTPVLFDLETMTKTQSIVMPDLFATCFAVSPDSKQLVVVCSRGRIRLLQTDDFSIQRDLDTTGEGKAVCSVAFDPTCRILAIGYHDGSLELRRL
jgi:WD40 repeat protein